MTKLSLFHKCCTWYKSIYWWHRVNRITLLAAMSGITLVCIFALAQAINTVVIPPEIDQLNSLNIPRDELKAEHDGLIMDYSKTTSNKQASEGCSRTEGAFICNGNDAGKPKKMTSEAECAAYCWGIEGCQFWTYYHGLGCAVKTASNCTGPYEGSTSGSRQCGAPATTTTVCQSARNVWVCAGDELANYTMTTGFEECAGKCRATEGCKFWASSYWSVSSASASASCPCFLTASTCTTPMNNAIWGSRECGAPTDAWVFNISAAPSFMSVCGKFILILS